MNRCTLGTIVIILTSSIACQPPQQPAETEVVVEPVMIELASYTPDDIEPAPSGTAEIIGGTVVIDFEDTLSLEEIDGTLQAEGLMRAGFVGGINVVTAQASGDEDEVALRDRLSAVSGIEGTALNYVLREIGVSGALPPVLGTQQTPPPEAPTGADLLVNWPHWVMDTFPAHALTDEIMGSEALSDVVLAVIDKGSFHDQPVDGVSTNSIFDTQDPDLGGKFVSPIAIVSDPATAMPIPRTGPATLDSNSLVTAPGASQHGLRVASAAAGGGEDILGTSRHVRIKPVFISSSTAEGRCSNDTTIRCSRTNPCSRVPGSGSCEGIAGVDFLIAAVTALANNLDATEAANLRVVNISLGFPVNADDSENIRRMLTPAFKRLVDGNRIVVLAADDDPGDTSDFAPTLLAPERSANRSTLDSPERGLVVVAGTKLPIADVLQLLNSPVEFAGLDFDDQIEAPWEESATGANVTISAPAKYVPVLQGDLDTREMTDGNSFAAPYVAGAAAELLAIDPSATSVEAIDILTTTADRIVDPNQPDALGAGRLNLWKAVLRMASRNDLSNPVWVGVRFRFAGNVAPDARIVINSQQVPDIVWKRVPDVEREVDSNAREVPSATVQPASLSASFSMMAADFDAMSGGIGSLELQTSSGTTTYEVPIRMKELLSIGDRPLDTLLDNLVVTFDVQTDQASIYGRVTNEDGAPIADACIEYESIFDQTLVRKTDEDGYYIIYDALPDAQFELYASAGEEATIVDVQIANHASLEQNFVLVEEDEMPDDMVPDDDEPEAPTDMCDTLPTTFDMDARLDGGALTCVGSGRTVIVDFTADDPERMPVFPVSVVVEGLTNASVPCREWQDCDPVESMFSSGSSVTVPANVFCDEPPDDDRYGAVYSVRITDDCGRLGSESVVLLCCPPDNSDCTDVCGQ